MPKSDTWPGGIAIETMTEMDSTGSCDSVVSINSGFSDDSLEHLSAEERACLMFLEETIESLETEEDSGMSNDEPDCLPAPGNVATKTAHLSASMGHSKLSDMSKYHIEEPVRKGSIDHRPILNYLVPTPFVLANGTSCFLPKARRSVPTDEAQSRMDGNAVNGKVSWGHPRIPSEVNVVVIPPPSKLKSQGKGQQEEQRPECVSSRGPLSYEGLVQLRKSASMKKTPTVPATETRTGEKQTFEALEPNEWGTPGLGILARNEQNNRQNSQWKTSPPAVAPKPNKMPSNIALTPQKSPSAPNTDSSSPSGVSPSDQALMNPQKVRMEALHKLGLLKDEEVNTRSSFKPVHPPKSHRAGYLPPPCDSTRDPHPTSARPAQGSSILHHRSMSELPTFPPHPQSARPTGAKAATLERSGMGLGSYPSSQNHSERKYSDTNTGSQSHLPHSSTLESRKDFKDIHDDGRPLCPSKLQGSGKTSTAAQPVPHKPPHAQPVPHKPPHGQGLRVLMVQGMGDDRREALRKLGLLKD